MSTTDLIIVGAGVVGAACAAECARAGLTTLVLDRGPIGGGTTAAAMGHLVVMDDSEAQFALTAYARRLWLELAAELPADVEYDPCGTLWVAADEQELAEVQRKHRFYAERGVRTEVLDAAAVARAEPNLRPGLVGGLRVPDDAVVYPPCAARWLLERAQTQQARTEVRTGVEVRSLTPRGEAVLADGTTLSAGMVVNAAGCWAPTLSPGLPVRKRKGHLVITDRYPSYVKHQIIELGYLKCARGESAESVAFNIQPRATGQMLIGSSRQFDAEDTDVDYSVLQRMLRRAVEYLPTLDRLSAVRVWTGHRPATPDKLPLIGRSADSPKIWLAAGHEGLGITTSLATGRLLADLILNRPTEIPAAPYSPARTASKVGGTLRVPDPLTECAVYDGAKGGRCMADRVVTITVDGARRSVPAGTVVAAALAQAGEPRFRRSVTGQPRAPLCGMGVCFECRATINGRAHARTCQTLCEDGMEVRTDE